jgi:hypothetical protein
MKGIIETPRVPKLVLTLFTQLFYNVILTLENESSNRAVYGKQLDIKKCMENIQNFIMTHPYGIFNIEVLDSLKRDREKPILVLTFRNFGDEVKDKIPMVYHIIIDETYTTYEVFQASPDGILITIRV